MRIQISTVGVFLFLITLLSCNTQNNQTSNSGNSSAGVSCLVPADDHGDYECMQATGSYEAGISVSCASDQKGSLVNSGLVPFSVGFFVTPRC